MFDLKGLVVIDGNTLYMGDEAAKKAMQIMDEEMDNEIRRRVEEARFAPKPAQPMNVFNCRCLPPVGALFTRPRILLPKQEGGDDHGPDQTEPAAGEA